MLFRSHKRTNIIYLHAQHKQITHTDHPYMYARAYTHRRTLDNFQLQSHCQQSERNQHCHVSRGDSAVRGRRRGQPDHRQGPDAARELEVYACASVGVCVYVCLCIPVSACMRVCVCVQVLCVRTLVLVVCVCLHVCVFVFGTLMLVFFAHIFATHRTF